jgi:aquaporin Z
MQTRSWLAESLGSFMLVFVGAGAVVVDQVSGGAVTHVGVALTFGLVVMALIYALGDVSGAHLNPAVTVGFWLARRFDGRSVLPYVLSQVVGAVLASLLLKALFPTSLTLGATLPAGSSIQSLVLEVVLTALLMFVILSVSTGAKEKGVMAGTAVGAVVGLEALFAGPISGASMNPARSFGPAVVSGQLSHIWIYVIGPVLGVFVSVLACRCVQAPGCCEKRVNTREGRTAASADAAT